MQSESGVTLGGDISLTELLFRRLDRRGIADGFTFSLATDIFVKSPLRKLVISAVSGASSHGVSPNNAIPEIKAYMISQTWKFTGCYWCQHTYSVSPV